MVINHLTAPWYTKRLEMLSEVKAAFCLFLLGKKDEAIDKLEIILQYDELERYYYERRFPNLYSRLKFEFENNRMFALQEEIESFSGVARKKLLIADFYYEIEEWDEAYWRYRELDRLYGNTLNRVARAYLDVMLAYTASTTRRYDEAYERFSRFEKDSRYYKTHGWRRAMKWLSTYYQNKGETREKSVECLWRIYEAFPKSDHGFQALLAAGLHYWVHNRDREKVMKVVEIAIKEGKGTWVEEAAKNLVSFMERSLSSGKTQEDSK